MKSFLILAVAMFAWEMRGATINVTSYGAAPNDGADNLAAINNAINASVAGDTILFPAGVYNISGTVTLKANRNYAGAGATLKRGGSKAFAVSTEWDNGKNILLDGLTLDNGGINVAGSGTVPVTNIVITNVTIMNITSTNWPSEHGIYIPTHAVNYKIVGNFFMNIFGDNGIITYNITNCLIADNRFDFVNEGMHLLETTANTKVLRNWGTRIRRMGIEIQGSHDINLRVEDNHFSHFCRGGDQFPRLNHQQHRYPDALITKPRRVANAKSNSSACAICSCPC